MRQAIESVLHQTQHVDKTIIINNGSTDLTDSIAREFLELYYPYIEYHPFTHNRGQCTAFNRGLELTKTQYVCFLDGDDELDRTYVSRMLHTLTANKTAAFAYSNTLIFGPRERSTWLTYPSEWRKKEGSSYIVYSPDFTNTAKYLLKKINYVNNGAICNTKCARDVGGFVEHENYDLRHYLWYRILDAGHTAAQSPHVIYRYRQHSILQQHWQWMRRKIEGTNPVDQQILYFQEEIERLKNSPFYKTEQILSRLADNFKCDCAK